MRVFRDAIQAELQALAREGDALREVLVAVVDSGVEASHPMLAGKVRQSWEIVAAGEGHELRRHRAVTDQDRYGHGTQVSGVLTKMAPNARILDIRVLDEHNSATGRTLLAGFAAAVESEARVINLSLAARSTIARELAELCEKAYRKGQVVVAAKRNMPTADCGYPAELSACISVDNARWDSFWRIGFQPTPPIEFAARGWDVPTCDRNGLFTSVNGTSYATPAVSAFCALLLGKWDLRPFELKTLLKWYSEREAPDAKP